MERLRGRAETTVRRRERVCQMQLCFVARLEPTRMRWKNDQVRTKVLFLRETNVQECNSDKSTCNVTERQSMWTKVCEASKN